MEDYTSEPNAEYTDEDVEFALDELEREHQEIRDKLESGEYRVYEGRVYSLQGEYMGRWEL